MSGPFRFSSAGGSTLNEKLEPDYDMIAAKTKDLKNSNDLKTEIFEICKSINMPNYFIVTVAEKGAFYGKPHLFYPAKCQPPPY